jgi:hypothetical protein
LESTIWLTLRKLRVQLGKLVAHDLERLLGDPADLLVVGVRDSVGVERRARDGAVEGVAVRVERKLDEALGVGLDVRERTTRMTHREAVVARAVEVGNCRHVLVLLLLLLCELDSRDGLASRDEEARRKQALERGVAARPGPEGKHELVGKELAAVGASHATDVAVLLEDQRLHLGTGYELCAAEGVDLVVQPGDGPLGVRPPARRVEVRIGAQRDVADNAAA